MSCLFTENLHPFVNTMPKVIQFTTVNNGKKSSTYDQLLLT